MKDYGVYIGADVKLEGKRAMLRKSNEQDCVQAQFNTLGLLDSNGRDVSHGWWTYPKSAFQRDKDD